MGANTELREVRSDKETVRWTVSPLRQRRVSACDKIPTALYASLPRQVLTIYPIHAILTLKEGLYEVHKNHRAMLLGRSPYRRHLPDYSLKNAGLSRHGNGDRGQRTNHRSVPNLIRYPSFLR